MDLDFLPNWIRDCLLNLNLTEIIEIRLRVGFPIQIKFSNNTQKILKSFNVSFNDIACIIDNLTEKSIYAYNENIKQGFLTYKGIRVGLCGNCIFEKENIITINNFTSLNIRIPHQVEGCSDYIFKHLYNGQEIKSSLILAVPGMGKTTILKDLANKLNGIKKFNILLIDERTEFQSVSGQFIDRIENSNKLFAFYYALRSLAPDIVITDEICDFNDMACAKHCVNSGLKIIASCHCSNITELKQKEYFEKGIFERYFVLSSQKIGQVVEVDNENLDEI